MKLTGRGTLQHVGLMRWTMEHTSFEQCRASVSGIDGFCTLNPYPGTGYGRGGTWNLTPSARARAYPAKR
jgi:hypothetical protein